MDLFITFVFSLVFTMFFYLLVPIIVAMCGKQYPIKTLKRIAIINGIVVWFLFQLVAFAAGGEVSNGSAAFLWSFVGYWLMKKKCFSENKTIDSSELVQDDSLLNEFPSATKERVYKRCGTPLDATDTYCSLCGKRHSKKVCNIKAIVTIVLLSITTISLSILCIVQYNQQKVLRKTITTFEKKGVQYILKEDEEYEEYVDFWSKNHDKVDFIDENIVFVIEGYGNYYYTYEQMISLLEKEEEFSYWAYNKEQAISKGYSAR